MSTNKEDREQLTKDLNRFEEEANLGLIGIQDAAYALGLARGKANDLPESMGRNIRLRVKGADVFIPLNSPQGAVHTFVHHLFDIPIVRRMELMGLDPDSTEQELGEEIRTFFKKNGFEVPE